MKLTISTWAFEAIPLEGALAVCQSMGFKGVDIAGFHNRGRLSYEPDEVGTNPQKAADHLLPLLDKYGLHAVDFFPQFTNSFYERSMNDPDPAVRQNNIEMFKGIIKFCKLVKIPGITLLPGVEHLAFSREKNLDVAGETFRKLVEIGTEADLLVRFEPHMGSLTNTPELALALIERAPGLTVTLDYTHFTLQYIEMGRCHKLIPYTSHVHVRPARDGRLQTRHAEGTIDYVDIIKRLKAVNYQGCLSVEYVCSPWYDANQLDTLTETVTTKEALEPYLGVA